MNEENIKKDFVARVLNYWIDGYPLDESNNRARHDQKLLGIIK